MSCDVLRYARSLSGGLDIRRATCLGNGAGSYKIEALLPGRKVPTRVLLHSQNSPCSADPEQARLETHKVDENGIIYWRTEQTSCHDSKESKNNLPQGIENLLIKNGGTIRKGYHKDSPIHLRHKSEAYTVYEASTREKVDENRK